tara:strand:+ start:44640 stop:44870 length:231 start_codon:yes stop_codon:yes gene_type:complete
MMSYIPKVNDYVQWKNHEGWVYFFDELYITIELGTSSKKDIKNGGTHHQKNHILLVCPNYQWKELKYIKKRKTVYD